MGTINDYIFLNYYDAWRLSSPDENDEIEGDEDDTCQ